MVDGHGGLLDRDQIVYDQVTTLPKLNSVDAAVVMGDLYDECYGIFNHGLTGSTRPLSSVAFHEAENIIHNSLLEEALQQYISNHIYDRFHLTVMEFLDLPSDYIELMVKVAQADTKQQSTVIDTLERELNKKK